MDPLDLTRRAFLGQTALGLGALSLNHLLDGAGAPHHAPRAKRIVYLFQSGGPAQHDLFDHKPVLNERWGEELPASIRQGQRLTAMSGHQATLPLAGTLFKFARHGACGTEVSELLPETAKIVDKLCVIRSMHTEAIKHDPGITFFQTGSQIAGRPSIGSWLSYGLGSLNRDLPDSVILVTKNKGGQPLYARLWGAGFLPSKHQGTQLRPGPDP
ncbi:MAG: DUF1501 domain-containing protein, partial [Planctomycetes bacterium]|nr:DUF1501 domain-containing protein [Planctomycetota bacterium]